MIEGIPYNGRTLALGLTGSGKSELINVAWSGMRCQRALYDSKHEFAIDDIKPTYDVDEIDWQHEPIIHFRPSEDAVGDAGRFFAAAFRSPHALTIAVHEMGDTCDYNANAAKPSVKRYFVQGRAKRKGIIAGTQRPVGNPRASLTEAGDFFVFVPRLNEVDHLTVAREIGLGADALAAAVDKVHDQLGDYSYLHWNRHTRKLTACPPLPKHLRRRSIVRRVADA